MHATAKVGFRCCGAFLSTNEVVGKSFALGSISLVSGDDVGRGAVLVLSSVEDIFDTFLNLLRGELRQTGHDTQLDLDDGQPGLVGGAE